MKLTKKFIDTQVFNGKGQHVLWDDEVPGFGVRLYPTGKKAFVLSYRDNNRKSIMTIGSYSVLTLDQARKDARAKLVGLNNGVNPLQERQKERQGKLVNCVLFLPKIQHCWRRLKTDHPYRLKIDQGELLNSLLYSIGIVDQTGLVLPPFFY